MVVLTAVYRSLIALLRARIVTTILLICTVYMGVIEIDFLLLIHRSMFCTVKDPISSFNRIHPSIASLLYSCEHVQYLSAQYVPTRIFDYKLYTIL